MSTTLPQEVGIQPSGGIHSDDGDDDRVLKLIRAREDDGRGVGEHLEQVLERGLDGREGPAVIILDFLHDRLLIFMCPAWNMGTHPGGRKDGSGDGNFRPTSCMIFCADKSYPHRPIRLNATPTAKPVAENRLLVPMPSKFEKYQPSAPARHAICQARLHMPALTTPIFLVKKGAAQVALSSKTLLPMRAMPTCQEV